MSTFTPFILSALFAALFAWGLALVLQRFVTTAKRELAPDLEEFVRVMREARESDPAAVEDPGITPRPVTDKDRDQARDKRKH